MATKKTAKNSVATISSASSDEESISSVSANEVEESISANKSRIEKRNPKRPRPSRYSSESPSKYEEIFAASMKNKKVQVKCNQSGKLHKANVKDLSLEDGQSITEQHLRKGTEVLFEHNKKSYPVTVIKVLSENGEGCPKRQKLNMSDAIPKQVEDDDNTDSTNCRFKQNGSAKAKLQEVKESFQVITESKSLTSSSASASGKESSPKAVMDILLEIRDMVKTFCNASAVKAIKSENDDKFIVNGINLLQIPAKDMCAYGRSLLEVLFTKQEQATSVVVKTKKSDKPPLSPSRVQLLFDCVEMRYQNYDYKALMTTLGQKCRDATREVKKSTPN